MSKSAGPSTEPPSPAHVRPRRRQVIRAGLTGVLGGVLVVLGVLYHPVAAASESTSDTARLPGPATLVVEASGNALRVSWAAVPDAERYRVRWWLEGTGVASESTLTTAQTVVTIPNLSAGAYLVQVGACRGKPLTCTRKPDRTKRQVTVRNDKTLARLTRTFVGDATSVEEFVLGLPKSHMHRAAFMVDSQALDQDFVSEEHPRVISFGATADTIFAWGTDADSPRYEEVEFIAKETGDWAFGVIDFATTPPTVKREEEICQTCHIGDPPHPLWAVYPNWPGSMSTEYEAQSVERIEAWHETGDPRLTAIPVYPDDLDPDRMAFEFNDALAIRHGEVLIESVMPAELAAGVRFAQELLCRGGGWGKNVKARFPARQSPATMGDGQGGYRNVNPNKSPQAGYNSSNNTTLFSVIALYLVNYLVAHDEQVKALYEEVENTESARFSWHLHYAPETATALDELASRVQIAFGLKGGKQLKYRRNTQAHRFRDMQLKAGHLNYLLPKVCATLDAG